MKNDLDTLFAFQVIPAHSGKLQGKRNTSGSTLLFCRSHIKCKTIEVEIIIMSSSITERFGEDTVKTPLGVTHARCLCLTVRESLNSPKIPIYKGAATEKISNLIQRHSSYFHFTYLRVDMMGRRFESINATLTKSVVTPDLTI